MPVTRFLADMLYEEQEQTILPSFWGSNTLLLVGGCAAYGIFSDLLGGYADAGGCSVSGCLLR